MAKQGGKRHSAEQVVRKLRDAEALLSAGKSIGEACQSLEVSEQTLHRWRKKYGGMKAEEAKRLEALDQENGRLKKLVADLSLEVQMLKEIARGNF
jgi:putative transposase